MQVSLNRSERKVIRKIANMQLESLEMLLRGDIKEDLTLWRIEHQVEAEELDASIRLDIRVYENLYNNPHEFINLQDDDMSLVKHILHRYIKRGDLLKAKASIWRKMVYINSFHFNLN